MSDFDGHDCLQRYLRKVRATPGLAANPPGKIYEILTDPDDIHRAAAATREARRAGGDPAHDTRVGVLAEDPYVVVMREAVRFPDGGFGLYNRLVLGSGVVMLPVLGERIVLAHAFRHGTRKWHLEAPRGMLDGNGPLIEQARRELREEIGAETAEIVELGLLNPSPGIIEENLHLMLARIDCVGAVDAHEAISEAKVLTVAEFEQLVVAGEITDGPTLAVYLRAKLAGLV